jgi:hypothetical protein
MMGAPCSADTLASMAAMTAAEDATSVDAAAGLMLSFARAAS